MIASKRLSSATQLKLRPPLGPFTVQTHHPQLRESGRDNVQFLKSLGSKKMSTPAQLLEPLTNPSATADTVSAAVQGFNTQARASASTIGDYLWDAFNAVFKAAGRTPPEHQGRLIDFLAQLRGTTVTDAEGKVLKHEDGEVWRDLPTFGWVARDLWNFEPTEPSATARDISKWENWTTFLAQLTARSAGEGSDPFDFSLFALWALRDALEEEGRSASKPAVRLASLWVRFAGERLRKLSAIARDLDGNMGSSAGKYGQRGWKGFNEDRWKAWADELKAAQATLGPDETIERAVKLMEEL
ncbi:hypothetical protein VTG60DRAFT_935 [Thermothelomyces hinnuleus]